VLRDTQGAKPVAAISSQQQPAVAAVAVAVAAGVVLWQIVAVHHFFERAINFVFAETP